MTHTHTQMWGTGHHSYAKYKTYYNLLYSQTHISFCYNLVRTLESRKSTSRLSPISIIITLKTRGDCRRSFKRTVSCKKCRFLEKFSFLKKKLVKMFVNFSLIFLLVSSKFPGSGQTNFYASKPPTTFGGLCDQLYPSCVNTLSISFIMLADWCLEKKRVILRTSFCIGVWN